jgi:hypothetical protein
VARGNSRAPGEDDELVRRPVVFAILNRSARSGGDAPQIKLSSACRRRSW